MKTGRGWWAFAGVVALPFGLYVGAYYATIQPVPTFWGVLPRYGVPLVLYEGASLAFRPIHEFDKRLRPHVWNPPDFSPENSN